MNETLQPQPSQSNDDALMRTIANDLRSIEAKLMPELDELQAKIPEIYSGYANLVRETVSATINMLSTDNNTSSKIALGAEIAARGLEAFGKWKAAKKHNELLDRIMLTKKAIANHNIAKIRRLVPEVSHKLKSTQKLFTKYAETIYPNSGNNEVQTRRFASLNLRALNLYRTNLFLSELTKYLNSEYSCWMNNKQTSGLDMPDYYMVNEIITGELYGKKPFKILEDSADCTGDMTGAKIMLLSDTQLTIFALKNTLCTISPEEASPMVRTLIDYNPAFNLYTETVNDTIAHISKTPDWAIGFAWIITTLSIIALCIFYIPGAWWLKLIIGTSGVAAAYKIFHKNSIKLKILHCQKAEEISAVAGEIIDSNCGKIKQQNIDYEQKDTTKAFISGFLGA